MMQRYEAAVLHERVARARLLLQLASGRADNHLADLLTLARQIGGQPPAADTLVAFREAISEELQTAQAELDRLVTAPFARFGLPPHIVSDLVRLGLDPERATAGEVLEALVLRSRRRTAWRRALRAARRRRSSR